MSDESRRGRPLPDGFSDDPPVERLIRELDAVEARLDPAPVRRGRLWADLITVGLLAPIAFVLDWHASRPLLLLFLMAAGIGLNRLVPYLTTRSLRRRREALLKEYERLTGARVAFGEEAPAEPS